VGSLVGKEFADLCMHHNEQNVQISHQIPHHYNKANECNCLFKYMSMPKYIMTT
jgi:hypothetical protein